MQILSSYDLYKNKGKTLTKNAYSGTTFFQPLQFLPDKEKDDVWCSQYMDWAESEGLIQIKLRANWMMKNYKMAIGEIEKSDYIREDNEYSEMVDVMERQAGTPLEAMSLKFYPLANTVVNVLVDEFAKRVSHMTFDDKSPVARNEMLEDKKEQVNQVLLQQATIKQMQKMMSMGLSPDSDQGKQMIDPNTIKSLPEIQQSYDKSYRNIYQEWAQHQMEEDNRRFSIPEMEREQFRNMLITDREFWHFRMMENDYEIETWNPPQVFYKKSPSSRYISNASRVGYVEYLTIPDIIDMDGYKMTEEQLLSLNTAYGARGANYGQDGAMEDNYWNRNESYNSNRTGPGLGMRQVLSVLDSAIGLNGYNGDVIRQITNESEDCFNERGEYMLRRSTIYWKTQRKYYHLTKIDELGNLITSIVGEDYKVTTKPVYNEVLYKGKNKENLIYGEHLDPLWANEVWGGIRIGTNIPTTGWNGTTSLFNTIYIGINGGKPGRLPFQFKGDKSIYGCKLPVEGAIFTDHNTKSRALIDNLKPWQIGYNMANNMLQDTMVNDLGVLLQIDPNALIKNSLGDDYGPDTLQSTMTIARDLSVIQAYGAGKNADGEHVGQHPIQKLDLSQVERELGLMKIAQYFKEEGLNSVGLNAQRLGTPIEKEDTATGVQQQVAASFSHTEYLYIQHSDNLMPRVHQMRTDLAQYYNCTNPSVRLQYITENDDVAWFEVTGIGLLGRDFNVRCTTSINTRSILMQIKQLLMTNNTSGANLFDLVRGMQLNTLTEMNVLMKQLEKRKQEEDQQQSQAEQQQAEQEHQQQMQQLQEKQQFEAEENQKNRDTQIQIAEIKGAAPSGAIGTGDSHKSNYLDSLKVINNQQQHNDKMSLEKQKLDVDSKLKQGDQDIQRNKIQAEQQRTSAQLHIAKVDHKTKERDKKNKK